MPMGLRHLGSPGSSGRAPRTARLDLHNATSLTRSPRSCPAVELAPSTHGTRAGAVPKDCEGRAQTTETGWESQATYAYDRSERNEVLAQLRQFSEQFPSAIHPSTCDGRPTLRLCNHGVG